MENRCIYCDAVIPEGRMICPNCEHTEHTSHQEGNIQTDIMVELSKYGIPIRLNSGKAWQGQWSNHVIKNPRAIKLCPAGTPDIMCILPEGKILWVECKTATGRQREAQKQFQSQIERLQHTYIIARSVSDIRAYFAKK